MAIQPLIFLGASALPEIVEIVRDINQVQPTFRMDGVLDDNPALQGGEVEGLKILGPLEKVSDFPDAQFVLGIGSYRTRVTRFKIVQRLALPMERYATLIHPTVKVFASSRVGSGCVLHAGTIICNNSVLQDLVLMLPQCLIGAHNVVGEGCLMAAGVKTTGHVVAGYYSHCGLGACIGDNVRIGPAAQVAMGSIVLNDVPAGAFAFNNRYLDKVEVPPELSARWQRELPTFPVRGA
ncbi:MAG: hypothetical protein GXY83_25485 [Rhodopirellula sp.]|nr:hypothetical protein [Rhodopirellula sp.]